MVHVNITPKIQLPVTSVAGDVQTSVEYNLYAIVLHVGPTRSRGHYVLLCRNSAIAKNPSGDSSFGRTGWFYINDSVVRPVMENDIESVANGTSPVKEETPYMLFYRRVDSSGQAPISEPVPTSNFNVPKQVPLLLSALSAELVYNDNNTLHCVPAIPAVTPTSHGDQFGSFTGQGFGPISLDDCDITCIKTAETPETTVPSKTPKCPTQATQKPKSTQPRRLATSKWSPDDERIGPFKTELEAEKHLFGIKSDDAGGPIKLIKKAWVNNKKKTGYMRIRIFYCGFHTSCKCEFRCRIMQTQEGLFYVLIGNWPHSGHYNDTSKSVIPAIVKASITPSKLEMTSTEFITWLKFSDAVVKTEFPLNLTTTPHAVSLQKRLKQKHSVGNGEDTTTRTWGSLNRSISQVPTNPSHEDETYTFAVLSDPLAVMKKGPPGRLCVPLTTENLALNGYRALQFGMPLQILIDCEYGNTINDGFATMLIGVMDLSIHFHVIAYCVLNHEDEIGQGHALRETKKEVERVVFKYRGGRV